MRTGWVACANLADGGLSDPVRLPANRTTFGRNTPAIGGNEEAARLAGVPVVRTKIIIFVLSVWSRRQRGLFWHRA